MNTEEEIDDKEHTDETTVDQTKIQELPLIDYEESDKEECVSKNGSIMIEVEINSNPHINDDINNKEEEFQCENKIVKEIVEDLCYPKNYDENYNSENISENEFLNLFNELSSQLLEDSEVCRDSEEYSQSMKEDTNEFTGENLLKLIDSDDDKITQKINCEKRIEKLIEGFDSHVGDILQRIGFKQFYKNMTTNELPNLQTNSNIRSDKDKHKNSSVIANIAMDCKEFQNKDKISEDDEKCRCFDPMNKNKKVKKCMTYNANINAEIENCPSELIEKINEIHDFSFTAILVHEDEIKDKIRLILSRF